MEKLRMMWEVLKGRGVIYHAKLAATRCVGCGFPNCGHDHGGAANGVDVQAAQGNLVTIGGRSEIGVVFPQAELPESGVAIVRHKKPCTCRNGCKSSECDK